MQYTRLPLWLLAAGLLLLLAACVSPPEYPEEPVLQFESLSKNTLAQYINGPRDSLTITLSYTDGDGDLSDIDDDSLELTLIDTRLPEETIPFRLPSIPIDGTGNGISGDIFIRIVNTDQFTCCIRNNRICVADPSFPVDTFSYLIQLRDRAGNFSNVVRTEPIEILCTTQ